MVLFIRQRKLKDKTMKDILQIAKFGSIVWEFLSVIYEASWNTLTTNYNNKFFRQYIFAQLNKTFPSNTLSKKVKDISRIPSSIISRLSKSILEKFQFFLEISKYQNQNLYQMTNYMLKHSISMK